MDLDPRRLVVGTINDQGGRLPAEKLDVVRAVKCLDAINGFVGRSANSAVVDQTPIQIQGFGGR
jgi:hypothetical protein